jgi:hypothetical protein
MESKTQNENNAQRRREDYRAKAELFFNLYQPELGERFPKAHFDDFVARYMGDNHSAEDVEARGRQLQDLIHKHVEKAVPPRPTLNMDDVLAEYEKRRIKIERANLDAEWKETLLMSLRSQHLEKMHQLLEEP